MTRVEVNVSIPQIQSLSVALEIYYSKIEIGNAEIRRLFGAIGGNRIVKLKNKAMQTMIENDVPSLNSKFVNTKMAYLAWGLEITDLERRYKKLVKMGIVN